MERDASDPQSLNAYAYVRNSPTGLTDPTGMDDLCEWVDSTYNALNGQTTITGTETGGCCPPGETESAVVAAFGGQWTLCVGNEDNQIWQEALSVYDGTARLYNCMVYGCGPGGGGGTGANLGPLVGKALVALTNPNCAALYGGWQNAVSAIANTSYNFYTPGEANPFPNLPNSNWQGIANGFATTPTRLGETLAYTSRPGGFTVFGNGFAALAPGLASVPSELTQETVFLHELEHTATFYFNPGLSDAIDANYAADYAKLNTNCSPQLETQESPITTTLSQ